MSEMVGVESWIGVFGTPSPIKREALMFRRLAVPLLGMFLRNFEHSRHIQEESLNELEWLLGSGIIYEPQDRLSEEVLHSNPEDRQDSELEFQILDRMSSFKEQGKLVSLLGTIKHASLGLPIYGQAETELLEFVSSIVAFTDIRSRLAAIQLRELEKVDAYPILRSGMNLSLEAPAQKTEVVQIVLNALPIPDDTTSWEQIIEYRSDPDSYNKFLDLRDWMNEVARADLTAIEIEQKLEHLLIQYQRHMASHKMKVNKGTLETVIVSTAELAEDLVKLKWGKIAKGLFALKHRRIALISGELTSPGSQVAYIIKATETFSGQ
jgi:hypothetical protein